MRLGLGLSPAKGIKLAGAAGLAARANLLLAAEDFGSASWTKYETSVNVNTNTWPVTGTVVADRLTDSAPGGEDSYYAYQNVAKAASAIAYTISVYALADASEFVILEGSDGGSNYAQATFNLSTGTVGAATVQGNFTAASATISGIGSGWYRCILYFTSNTATTVQAKIHIGEPGTGAIGYFGTNASIIVCGAKLEAGQPISPYS